MAAGRGRFLSGIARRVDLHLAAGWTARLLVLILSFVNTRLLIDRIGTDGLAAYSIVLSLTAWLALANLSLPTTVQNALSRVRGANEASTDLTAHAFGAMLIISLALAPLAIGGGLLASHVLLSNYSFASSGSVVTACLFIYAAGQSQLLTQVLYAEHRPLWPNVYPAFASVYTTVALILAPVQGLNDFNLILILLSLAHMLVPVHAAWKLRLLDRMRLSLSRTLTFVREARSNLLFAVFSCIALALDYIVMSRTLQAIEIVHYNLVSRLYNVVLVVHAVMLANSWSPIADLMHGGRKQEARERLERLVRQGLALGGLLGLVILLSMQWLIRMWSGNQVGDVPVALGMAWWVYVMLRIWTDTYAMALLGYGQAGNLNRYIPVQAAASAAGQYLLGQQLGAVGVVLGMILSFLLTASWILPKSFYKLIKR